MNARKIVRMYVYITTEKFDIFLFLALLDFFGVTIVFNVKKITKGMKTIETHK